MIWWAQTQIRGGVASLGSLGLGVPTEVCWRTWVMLFTCAELLLGRSYTGMYVYIWVFVCEEISWKFVCSWTLFIGWPCLVVNYTMSVLLWFRWNSYGENKLSGHYSPSARCQAKSTTVGMCFEFVYIVIINEFQFNICGYLFILLLINFIFYVEFFYLLLYVPEFFFLSYSFVMFRIDFLLSIWVNLHIYIDIVFVDLVFGLKCLLIILYCIWQMKHLYFFWRKIKATTYVFQPRVKF